jgi:hypothetical protein
MIITTMKMVLRRGIMMYCMDEDWVMALMCGFRI